MYGEIVTTASARAQRESGDRCNDQRALFPFYNTPRS